jgi:hypothetical protein
MLTFSFIFCLIRLIHFSATLDNTITMGTFVSGSQNINQASKFTSPYMIGARDSLAMVYHPNNTLLLFGGEDQSNGIY